MIIPDANILIYAFNASSPFHKPAKRFWEDAINGNELIGISWVVLLAFCRLLSSRQVVPNPYETNVLVEIMDEWFSFDHVLRLEPTATTYQNYREFIVSLSLPGNLTTNAFIASTAKEHSGTIFTNDLDFGRFPGIIFTNPLLH